MSKVIEIKTLMNMKKKALLIIDLFKGKEILLTKK